MVLQKNIGFEDWITLNNLASEYKTMSFIETAIKIIATKNFNGMMDVENNSK